jgi:S-DNA-T family DNA segregation ATPase FtsK/SpoIIIE
MLFLSTENLKPKRIQSVYITEKEVKKVATWIRTNADSDEGLDEVSEMEGSLEEKLNEGSEQASEVMDFGMDQDPLYEEAKRVVVQTRRASASLLQRKLRIGYARAARLIDVLEDKGIVGPSQGAKSREVYASDESYKTEDSDKDSQDEEWEQV